MIFLTVIAFVVIFSILILVHEWGHFTMARRAGIKVEEFGFGLPPRAKKLFTDKKGTLYSLNWIPFGGFVRMYGEDNADPKVMKDKNSFASKSIAQRTGVIVGGVVMNFVLAWVLIIIGFTFGMKPFLVNQADIQRGIEQGVVEEGEKYLYIQNVLQDGSADESGLQAKDMVTGIDGRAIESIESFQSQIKPNQSYRLTIKRKDESRQVTVPTSQEGKMGFEYILTNEYEIHEVRHPFYKAPWYAGGEVVRLSILTLSMFGDVVVSLVGKFTVPDGVAGPVGIARMTHHFAQQGLMALIQFAALLSISLGVINIMPFPALDGGRFLFIVFEVLTRKKPNAKWEAIIHSIGFICLMLLIVVITWNDIMSLIG